MHLFFFTGSLYSYLTVMRVGTAACQAGVPLRWRPFNLPTFVAGAEVFWGDDRLDDAIEWARRR